jgi:hypothetical protein
MGDLLTAIVAGAVATFSLHYFYDIVAKASLVLGAGVAFLIWVTFRLNKA